MRVPLKLISKSHAIGSLLPKPNIAWQMCESDKFPPINIKSEVLLGHVCLVSVWDLFLSRLGHLLIEESRCRDDLTRASGFAGRLGRGGVGGSTGMQRISAAWLLNGEAQYRCLHVTIACEGLALEAPCSWVLAV